jgi:hypothetical protein
VVIGLLRRWSHRLEVEHVHRGAIQRGGAGDCGAEAEADRGRVTARAETSKMFCQDVDLRFLGAGKSDGETIQHEPSRRGDGSRSKRLVSRGDDLFAQVGGGSHRSPPCQQGAITGRRVIVVTCTSELTAAAMIGKP